MIDVKCASCGHRFQAPENMAGMKDHCPKCRAEVTVRAEAPRQDPLAELAAAVGPVRVRPPVVFWSPVAFHVVSSPEQTTVLRLGGQLEIRRGRIFVTGKSQSTARTGMAMAAMGGLVGALVGAAATKASKEHRYEIDATRSRRFYDERQRAFSLELPHGKWLALRGPSGPNDNFDHMLRALTAQYGERMSPAELGRLTEAQARMRSTAVIILIVCFAMIGILLLAILIFGSGPTR